MKLGLGLHLQSQGGGGVSGPVITINGTTGGVAIIGDHASITMSASEGTISARKWGSTPGGSEYGTGTSPTDYTAGDGGTLYATATVDGSDYSRSAPITYAAPVAAGGLADRNYATGSGNQTVDASADFTGSDISYTVSTAISGVTIDAGTGVVTIPTGSDATGTITVTGTNSGGSDQSAFSVTIAAASGSITFGEYTLVGAGAAPIAEADGTYGEFTVASGQIAGNTTPLAVGDVTIGGTTVSVVADTYSVLADQAEVAAAAADAPPASTRVALVRDGVAPGTAQVDLSGLVFTGGFTVRGTARGAEFSGFILDGSHNITLENLDIHRAYDPATPIMVQMDDAVDCVLRNCAVRSDDFMTGVDHAWESPLAMDGVGARGGSGMTDCVIEDNDFDWCRPVYCTDCNNVTAWRNTYERTPSNFGELHGNFVFNANRGDKVLGHGGGNHLGATGPNKPFANARWKIGVADSSSFVVGENITGGTSAATAPIVGIQTGVTTPWGTRDVLYLDGLSFSQQPGGNGFLNGETITGDIAGSSTMTTIEVGVFPYDLNDPHNSSMGIGGNCTSQVIRGNILNCNPAYRLNTWGDYVGICSGPKWNDPTDVNVIGYSGVICTDNIFGVTDNLGLQLGYMTNTIVSRNTVYVDPLSGLTTNKPGVNYSELGANVTISHNIAMTFVTTTLLPLHGTHPDTFAQSHENLCLIPAGLHGVSASDPMSYEAQFVGPTFSGLAADELVAALTPKPGSRLLAGPVNIGATGGYYDFDTNTLGTVPAWSKPVTQTATGVARSEVTFTTDDNMRITPFPTFTNTDEMTLIVGFRLDEAVPDSGSTDADVYLLQSANSSLQIRRLPSANGHCFLDFYLKDAVNGGAIGFRTSMTMKPEDEYVVWAISFRQSTMDLRVMKDGVLDPLVKVSSWGNTGYATGFAYHNIWDFAGSLGTLYISDEYLDFHDQATLDKAMALDGNAPSYGADGSTLSGTPPEVFIEGTAAELSAGGGINLGSAAQKYELIAGTLTDYVPDTTAPILSAPVGVKLGQASATRGVTTDEGDERLWTVTTTSATAPSVAQIKLGQDHTGAGAVDALTQLVTAPGAQSIANVVGLDPSTTYWNHYYQEDKAGNGSTVVTSASFTTDAATFTPVLANFADDGSSYLNRGADLTGSPATVDEFTLVVGYSPQAEDMGQDNYLLVNPSSSGYAVQLLHDNANGITMRQRDGSNTPVYIGFTSSAVVAGEIYLIIYSYSSVSGPNMVMVDTSDGTVINDTASFANTGLSVPIAGQGDWWIGRYWNGANPLVGSLERIQLFIGAGAYVDVTVEANRSLFVDPAGPLKDPANAVSAIGATPIINMYGTDFTTGNNRGTGGNFTVTGTITTV